MQADVRDVKVERYYPDVLINAKEFGALAKIVDPELISTWQALWQQMLNTFVYDIDIDGANRWESMLHLYPKKTDSLEIRRRTILTKINATLPYTFRSFQAMLNSIYGENAVIESVVYDKYELWLDIAANLLANNAELRRFAHVIVPANLAISASNTKICKINQYYGCALVSYRHSMVKASTDCDFSKPLETATYTAGVITTYKHIVVGGQ